MVKLLTVRGSTGSVGRQTLEVVSAHPKEFRIVGLACRSETGILEQQIEKYKPSYVGVVDEQKGKELARKLELKKIKVYWGEDALVKIACIDKAEVVVMAVVGAAGILPTIAAIRSGKTIALATKEVMVCAGDLINKEAEKKGVAILPVDSEHSAIFQCLHAGLRNDLNKIYLTCSGGAFRGMTKKELVDATPEQALRHPNWKMGKKITVDCATLMNKGLEVIEAQKLFNVSVDQIEVLIHPQSIVHSMVEFADGTIMAQLGPKDMRFPIRYALSYPKRLKNHFEFLNPVAVGDLNFSFPDYETFECLSLAINAAKAGGTMPVVLNAADEVAVKLFLEKRIKFLEIAQIIKRVTAKHRGVESPNLSQILEADTWARKEAGNGFVVS
jgi:1-deoxy-D-xylulose-5-phosphate reductoisomerase